MKKLTLTHKGRDSWDRPVYECNGQLYVDVDPRTDCKPKICTKLNNEFDGEPDTPIEVMKHYDGVEIEFAPRRDVWDYEPTQSGQDTLKVGDHVTYTNDNGVVFKGHVITGLYEGDNPTFAGRVYIDSDSPWYPVKRSNLTLEKQ